LPNWAFIVDTNKVRSLHRNSDNDKHPKQQNTKMTIQTQAVQNLINAIETALKASCVSYPQIMLDHLLNVAQEYTNVEGYAFDVALAKACAIYPSTKYCPVVAYKK
jgi:hypothetical protein